MEIRVEPHFTLEIICDQQKKNLKQYDEFNILV